MSIPTESLGRRRVPKQRRSRTMVECIKQAAMELIASEGFLSATTARIAERAGISIGSLYQYFATREAIFLTLYEDVSVQLVGVMKRDATRIMHMPLEKAVRAAVSQMLTLHEKHKLILIDLVREMPELNLASHPVSYDNLMRGTIKAFVAVHTGGSSLAEMERIVFFLERIIIDSVRAYLRSPPAKLSKRAFIDEVTNIVVPYLQRQVRNP